MKKTKFYGMGNDYMFHAVLQEAEDVLKNLVAAVMNMHVGDINSCKLENPIELGKSIGDKDCVLDVKLVLNNLKILNIELQMWLYGEWQKRSLLYWARAYDCIESGEDYAELMPTYHIGILDYTLFKDNPQFFSEYKILNIENYREYTDVLNIRIIDLTQISEAEKKLEENAQSIRFSEGMVKWAKIFKAKTMSELEQLAGEEEALKKMVYTVKKLSEDEKIKQQCEARAKFESDWITTKNAITREATEKGLAEGREKGLAEGREKGLAEGREKGLAEGREKGLAEGRARGRAEGLKDGELTALSRIVIKKARKNKSLAEISDDLEEDIEVIRPIYDIVSSNPEMDENEVVSILENMN